MKDNKVFSKVLNNFIQNGYLGLGTPSVAVEENRRQISARCKTPVLYAKS